MHCAAHTLQLCVEDVLEENQISCPAACCRQIVWHFKHSYKQIEALKKQQEANIVAVLSVVAVIAVVAVVAVVAAGAVAAAVAGVAVVAVVTVLAVV